MYNIVFKEEATKDIQEAYSYYEAQNVGLGDKFLNRLSESLDDLEQHPTHYGYLFEKLTFRSKSLLPFPFIIAFELTTHEVIIYAVHKTHINPAILLQKLNS